ncbi:MAG: hypothetical protein ACXVAY_06585 [Mucilaginibacter sp.]
MALIQVTYRTGIASYLAMTGGYPVVLALPSPTSIVKHRVILNLFQDLTSR